MGIEWGIELLGDILKRIIKEFPLTDEERAKKRFKGDKTANFMRREATTELKTIIKDSYGLDTYFILVSPGQGRWNHRPWGGIRNEEVSTSFENGFYVVYLFSTDRKGVYLSLNQGYTNIERDSEIKDKIGELEQRSIFLRNNISKIPEDFLNLEIDCKDEKREKTQAGNIISKYYSIDDLDNEKILLKDLNTIMEIYNELIPIYKQEFIEKSTRVEKNQENDDLSKKVMDNRTRIWKVTPGDWKERKKLWPLYKSEGFIGIGWMEDSIDYSKFNSIDEVKEALSNFYEHYKTVNPTSAAQMILNFTNEIKVGDWVIANGTSKKIIGIGVITSDYIGPYNDENPHLFDYFEHLRKVDWLITEELESPDALFDRKTVTEIDETKWNKIKELYIKKYPKYKEVFTEEIKLKKPDKTLDLIKDLFFDFSKNYQNTAEGKDHFNTYDNERSETNEIFQEILDKKSNGENVTSLVLNKLLPLRGNRTAVAAIPVGSVTAYGWKEEDLPKLAEEIIDFITKMLMHLTDINEQKKIISSFIPKKGFQTSIISDILYYLEPKYLFINTKTVDTYNYISNEILKQDVKISTSLENYVENNLKLKELIDDLSKEIPNFSNYDVFDAFCHWMCVEDLGGYARGKPLPYEIIVDNSNSFEICPEIALMPHDILTKLKINSKILHQVCGTLNSKNHILLTGAPGTGKTHLAEEICRAAEKLNFSNGHILTTATSDWTTFDTIGGYMPDEDGKLKFEEGKFLQAINENKWLIIDEINRSDIDKAFGQLFTVLSGQSVDLPYKDNNKSIKVQPANGNESYYDEETSTYNVGNNWRILATMNVYDKDYLFEMSYAFMRRFTFIYVDLPDYEDYLDFIGEKGDNLNLESMESIIKLLEINQYREIGPAIFKDIINYAIEREKMENGNHIVEDAIISYILPQFEGLDDLKIRKIWDDVLDSFNSAEMKRRLEEISGISLDKS